MIKPAYSVSFLLSINIFVWQNVLYFLYSPRTIIINVARRKLCSCGNLRLVMLTTCVTNSVCRESGLLSDERNSVPDNSPQSLVLCAFWAHDKSFPVTMAGCVLGSRLEERPSIWRLAAYILSILGKPTRSGPPV